MPFPDHCLPLPLFRRSIACTCLIGMNHFEMFFLETCCRTKIVRNKNRNGPDYQKGLPEWTFMCVLEYFSFGFLGQIGLEYTQTVISLRIMWFKYS